MEAENVEKPYWNPPLQPPPPPRRVLKLWEDGPAPFHIPAAWTESCDAWYAGFLAGRKGARIVCRFTLPDGTVLDGPCRLDGAGNIHLVRPNKSPRQGFGLL